MLTPSELRDKAKWLIHNVDMNASALLLLEELCEQVAELREQNTIHAGDTVYVGPHRGTAIPANTPDETGVQTDLDFHVGYVRKQLPDGSVLVGGTVEDILRAAILREKNAKTPRILKASEITEPGTYACRAVGQKGWSALEQASHFHTNSSLRITHGSDRASQLSVIFDDLEFYGPIQLPE